MTSASPSLLVVALWLAGSSLSSAANAGDACR